MARDLALEAVIEFSAKNLAALTVAKTKIGELEKQLGSLQQTQGKTTGSWGGLSDQLNNVGARSFSNLTRSMSNAGVSVGQLGPRIANLATGLANASLVITALTEGVKLATLPMRFVIKVIGEVVAALGRMTRQAIIGTGALGLIGGALAGLGLSQIVKVNAEFESFGVQLETLYKSKDKAQAMLEWIRVMGEKTPFDVSGLTQAAVHLKAYGLEAQKWLPLVGDFAAGMQRPVEDAAMAVGKALVGETERLKEMAITSEQLIAAGAKKAPGGGIATQGRENRLALTGALEKVLTENFAGAMKRAGGTWRQMLSEMQDLWDSFMLALGKGGLFENVKRILSVFLATVGKIRDSGVFTKLGESLGKLSTGITDKIVGLIQKLPQALEWLGKQWPRMAEGISSAWERLKAGMAWVWERLPFWLATLVRGLATTGKWLVFFVGLGIVMFNMLKYKTLGAVQVVVDAITLYTDVLIDKVDRIRKNLVGLGKLPGAAGRKFREWGGIAAEAQQALLSGRTGLRQASRWLGNEAGLARGALESHQIDDWVEGWYGRIDDWETRGVGRTQSLWEWQQKLPEAWQRLGASGASPMSITGVSSSTYAPGSWEARNIPMGTGQAAPIVQVNIGGEQLEPWLYRVYYNAQRSEQLSPG